MCRCIEARPATAVAPTPRRADEQAPHGTRQPVAAEGERVMWIVSARALITRGLLTAAFGLLLLAWPSASIEVLVVLFGTFCIVEAVVLLTAVIAAAPDAPGQLPTIV